MVVQELTRYWNEFSTRPNARTICCMTPRVNPAATMVGPRAM